MAQWIGYMVSIKCSDDLGTFQGEIISATNTEIVLAKAFRNGIPCPDGKFVIRAVDIVDLKLIHKQSDNSAKKSTVTIAKPIAKRASGAGRTQSASEGLGASKNNNCSLTTTNVVKSKPIDINGKPNNAARNQLDFDNRQSSYDKYGVNDCSLNSFKNNTPGKKDKNKLRYKRDEECFGSPLDSKINKDFDFEKNLALFDKQAVWDELNNKSDVLKCVDNRRLAKYRHDENVIPSTSTVYRQITVPKQDFCEYVTDDGLIIPSISRSLRKRLWEVAEKAGLTWERRTELMGRATTELSIQLLGGAHRLNPRNSHQVPSVVILCGPHKQGALGINAARQIASHGIKTILYCISTESSIVKKELPLYALTKNKVIHTRSELPDLADLIIVALCEDTENPKNYPDLAAWINRNRAPVLALDPPSCGTPGITPKFSLLPVFPLPHSHNNGKLYLCNLGFPVDVFNEVGIRYKSPFGPKFVIPLHPRDD